MSSAVHFPQDAETSVLGAVLIAPAVLPDVLQALDSDCFYSNANAAVFAAIKAIDARGQVPDPITVSTELEEQGKLNLAGGRPYVHSLISAVPSAANALQYAGIVKTAALRRRLADVSRVMKDMTDANEDPGAILSTVQNALDAIEDGSVSAEMVAISDSIGEYYAELMRLSDIKQSVLGAETGFYDIDDTLNGLVPGRLVLLAARPAMGKTAFALAMLKNVASRLDSAACALFSLEMTAHELNGRLVSAHAKLPGRRLQKPAELTEADWHDIASASSAISRLPIFIDDATDTTVADIRAKARRLKRRKGLDLLVVDYIGLIRPPRSYEQRDKEVSEISRALKNLAGELDVPVLALSQLNRNVEARMEKRPLMSDLRDSGSLEQDADQILMLYRDEYYSEDSPDKGLIEVITRKNRHGDLTTAKLGFRSDCGWFGNLPRQQ